jgi:hypothetical protein
MVAFSSLYNLGLVFFAVSLAAARNVPPHLWRLHSNVSSPSITVNGSNTEDSEMTPSSLTAVDQGSAVPDVQQRTVQLLLGQEGLLSVPIPTAIAIDLPKGIEIFAPVFFRSRLLQTPLKAMCQGC